MGSCGSIFVGYSLNIVFGYGVSVRDLSIVSCIFAVNIVLMFVLDFFSVLVRKEGLVTIRVGETFKRVMTSLVMGSSMNFFRVIFCPVLGLRNV